MKYFETMRFTYSTIVYLFFWAFFFSTKLFSQIVIEVKINTPLLIEDTGIFLSTDKIEWNPGNNDHRLYKIGAGYYRLILDGKPENFEYKFTQGSWATVEGNADGMPMGNRIYTANGRNTDTIKCVIEGWEKLISYSIIVKKIPTNTPQDAKIYISGNFNNWKPADEQFILKRNADGTYRRKVYSELENLAFKFTRGSLPSIEATENGKIRPIRQLRRTTTTQVDHIEYEIEGWEDLNGSFSFLSFFDLLLLFAVFQGLLFLIIIPLFQHQNLKANRWIMLMFAVSCLCILSYLLANYENTLQRFPKFYRMSDIIYFLFGPLFYLYLRNLLFKDNSLPSRWYLHFIPFFIQLFFYLPIWLELDETSLQTIRNHTGWYGWIFSISSLLGLFWNMYYWILNRKTIKHHREQFISAFSYDPQLDLLYLSQTVLLICLIIWSFFLIFFLSSQTDTTNAWHLQQSLLDSAWLCFSAIIYLQGYFTLQQPETYKVEPKSLSIFDDILETTVNQSNIEVGKSKESNTGIIELLEQNLTKNKAYANPKLSLQELSQQINTAPHILSKAINEHYDKNFFELINSHRIEAFKYLLRQPKYQNYTLLALAYEVGFNSKSAFNRAFKKATGLTPKEYFDNIKEEKMQEISKETDSKK